MDSERRRLFKPISAGRKSAVGALLQRRYRLILETFSLLFGGGGSASPGSKVWFVPLEAIKQPASDQTHQKFK